MIFLGNLWRWLVFQIQWFIEYRVVNKVEPVLLPDKGWHYRFTNRFTGKVRYDYFPMLVLAQVGVSFSAEQQERIKALVKAGQKANTLA